jgi:hypothetical protein
MTSHAEIAMLAALKNSYGGEALFRPSSISRTMNCPGSTQLIARAPKQQRFVSEYALDGTAMHTMAEKALHGEIMPDEWIDRHVEVKEGNTVHKRLVTAEMADAVETYVDGVRSKVTAGVELLVERYMSLSALDPADPVLAENRGTGDAILLDRARRRIGIDDLKSGKGVMVAADSPQLKNYALLATFNYPIEGGWREVELTIRQPRAVQESERLKTVVFDPAELMLGFMGALLEAMHGALAPDPPLKTGPWCRWCPGKDALICPAIAAEAMDIGRDVFNPGLRFSAASMMGPIPTTVHLATPDQIAPSVVSQAAGDVIVLPDASGFSAADCATILDREHLWDTFIEAVKSRAARFIEAGVTVPGWMMSSRSGNRRWKATDEKETQEALRAIGLKTAEMYEIPKLKSPAQVEKMLKKDAKALLEPLVERPEGKPTLMRATADRPAVAHGMGPITE